MKPENIVPQKLPTGSLEFEIEQPRPSADPVIVDAGEFGFSTEAPDNTQGLGKELVAACRTRQASKLLLPKGTFRFTSNTPLNWKISGILNWTGNGAMFVFHSRKNADAQLFSGTQPQSPGDPEKPEY